MGRGKEISPELCGGSLHHKAQKKHTLMYSYKCKFRNNDFKQKNNFSPHCRNEC